MRRPALEVMAEPPGEVWSAAMVADRIAVATYLMRRLPDTDRAHFRRADRAGWPDVVRSYWDAYKADSVEGPTHVGLDAGQVDLIETVLDWLAWLTPLARRIVWGHALRVGWAKLLEGTGYSRQHGDRIRARALEMIARRLRDQKFPVDRCYRISD